MRPLSRWGSRVVRRVVPHSVRRRLRAPAVGSILALVVALATTGFTYQLLDRAQTGADATAGPRRRWSRPATWRRVTSSPTATSA